MTPDPTCLITPGVPELVHPYVEHNAELQGPPEQSDPRIVHRNNLNKHGIKGQKVNRLERWSLHFGALPEMSIQLGIRGLRFRSGVQNGTSRDNLTIENNLPLG